MIAANIAMEPNHQHSRRILFDNRYSWPGSRVPPCLASQRERIGTWRLRQIMKGRATHRDVLQLEPTESELAQEGRRSLRKLPRERGDKPQNMKPPSLRSPKSHHKTSSPKTAKR